MQFMSQKPYEHFLVEKLKHWLENQFLQTIDTRFQFKSPDHHNTIKIIAAMREMSDGSIEYKDVELPYLVIGDKRLLFAGHKEEHSIAEGCYTESYISMLRDAVSSQKEIFENTALVIIHNSRLDTILSTTFDLSSAGAVWSPSSIKDHLSELISQTGRYAEVSECLLEHQALFVEQDGASMFGFRELYAAMVDDNDLRFEELGLFPDKEILKSDDKEHVAHRLQENREWMEKIAYEVEHFPNELEEHLTELGAKFVNDKIKDKPEEDWQTIEFGEILKEIEEQKRQELEFIEVVKNNLFTELEPRSQSETAAGRRKINIIITSSGTNNDCEFVLNFDGRKLAKEDLRISPPTAVGEIDVAHSSHKNKTKFTIKCSAQERPFFFTLYLKRERTNEKYRFQCVILNEGQVFLDDIVNCFQVDVHKQQLVLEANETELRFSPSTNNVHTLTESKEKVDINLNGLINFKEIYENSDSVDFSVVKNSFELKLRIEGESSKTPLKLPQILNVDRFNQLFTRDDTNGVYKASKETVVVDNQESKPIFEPGKLLSLEYKILQGKLLFLKGEERKSINDLRNAGFEQLADQLNSIFGYLAQHKTLPSLCSWGEIFSGYVREYINSYLTILEAIQQGHTLTDKQKLILQIGFIEHKGKKYISPYHPLTLSYYLHIADLVRKDGDNKSFRDLPAVTIDRLSSRGLFPYMFDDKADYGYVKTVEDDPMWLEIVPSEESSFEFVETLVRDKVEEFIKTFGELFSQVDEAPLIISSVNNGKNTELFKGLVDYFKRSLSGSRRIHVNLYDDSFSETEFDEFAELGSYEDIKNEYQLDKGKNREYADTIIDLLRTKLTFSKFKHNNVSEQLYSHLTFFKNNHKVKCVANDLDNHLSGVGCDGLLSGETSEDENDNYFTGFGLKNTNISNYPHLKIASLVNRLLRPALSPSQSYDNNSAIKLAVSGEFRELLDRSYESSLWTTIIDPKVTLSFFDSSKGVLLIHYSDQYTSSSGYDAITVTKREDLYKSVLNDKSSNLINEFNAFNGEWLLKLVTNPEKQRLEKQGIIGAYKVVSCLLSKSEITWVPLSVAEMIRVAGNIGLAISGNDFSRHNFDIKAGAISDDVLFAGFKHKKLYLLPLEVKTGARPNFKKARTQALELKRYMEEVLLDGDTLKNKIFRSLFVRQVLLQVEKYELYEVFEDGYFNDLKNHREEWLTGDFEVGKLGNYPSGIVVAHLRDGYVEKYEVEEDVLQIELPMGFLDNLVKTPHKDLHQEIVVEQYLNIPNDYFLTYEMLFGDVLFPSSQIQDTAVSNNEISTECEAVDKEIQIAKPLINREPLKIVFGTDTATKSQVFWEPTNTDVLFNTNTGIIGTMGTGKTQFTKSLITQLYRNQQNNVGGKTVGVLIFDYKADYIKDDFVKATNAKVFKPYNLPYNPFALYGNMAMLPVHAAGQFTTTLTSAFRLGVKQQTRIHSIVLQAYEAAGILPHDESTWSKQAPTMKDIWALYGEQEKVEQDALYAALYKLETFSVFEADTNKTLPLYDLIDGVTVINLSGYDASIQNLIVALTLDLFYTQMHQNGSSELDGSYRQMSKMILVDEADNFMSQDFESLRKILKEGREFGVGTILSTQELTHFKTNENDYSSAILTWVIHQVANLKNSDIKTIFNTTTRSEEDEHMANIRQLKKHYSIHIGGEKKPRLIKDLAFWEIVDG